MIAIIIMGIVITIFFYKNIRLQLGPVMEGLKCQAKRALGVYSLETEAHFETE